MDQITVQTTVSAPMAKVWECWSEPHHITGWAFASDEWEAPEAENDLRVGGKFKTVMAAKDGSASFGFTGTYTAVKAHELIEYDLDDGRQVRVDFQATLGGVKITESFEPENEFPAEAQKSGWQSILDSFKRYAERAE